MWWAGINLGFLSWEKLGRFFISWDFRGFFYSMGTIYYGEGLGGGGGGGGGGELPLIPGWPTKRLIAACYCMHTMQHTMVIKVDAESQPGYAL